MNESASTETPFFGTQLSRCECSVSVQSSTASRGVARPAQCGDRDLGETSLGGRAGNSGPKYSRTITTPVRAPGSQEVDFLSQFCKVPSPPPILSFTSVSRGLGFNSRCGAFRRHNNCQFEALENQAIRTQCAADQYLNARENGSSLGQSVKIGQNCMVGQFYRAFPDIIRS